ncbi:LOW QUALITY PROTEIN: hypothetical protein MAR_021664 [Mya arenaria]|uniref:Chromo domain-containing protein n=1 Tax=Mya arenaria TaxID=6604 RepID=A0ABY7EBC5_MYAAR|nr:LOW QUALITY PROTEIN: hypothetical protein MAR_021664 [Mya arenaria]
MAGKHMQPHKEKNFFDRYQTLLETYWFPLMTNSTLREIVQQVNEFRSKGISLTSAVKRVLKKKKIAFEDLFDLEDSEESEEDKNEEEYMDRVSSYKVQTLMREYDIFSDPKRNKSLNSGESHSNHPIKRRLYRYFTHNDSYSYLPVLQDIAYSYNHTYHRIIGMPPSKVIDSNQEEVRLATYFTQNRKYAKPDTKLKPFKFKVGNYVRISHLRNVFTPASDETYTGEIFQIHKRYHRGTLPSTDYVTYKMRKLKEQFMNLNCINNTFKIDKIEKTKGIGKYKQYFVKWKYYPKKFNSWIKASDFE